MSQQQRGHGGGHQQRRTAQQDHGGGHQASRDLAQQGRGFAGQQGHGRFAQPRGGSADRQQTRADGALQQSAQQQAFAPQQQFGIQQLGRHGDGGKFGGAQYSQNYAASPYNGLTYGNNVQVLPFE